MTKERMKELDAQMKADLKPILIPVREFKPRTQEFINEVAQRTTTFIQRPNYEEAVRSIDESLGFGGDDNDK